MIELEATIAKWRRVVCGVDTDKGSANSPLCKTFLGDSEGQCKKCPVAIKSGKALCSGTPYEDWADYMTKILGKQRRNELGWYVMDEESRVLANNVLNSLIDLRSERM